MQLPSPPAQIPFHAGGRPQRKGPPRWEPRPGRPLWRRRHAGSCCRLAVAGRRPADQAFSQGRPATRECIELCGTIGGCSSDSDWRGSCGWPRLPGAGGDCGPATGTIRRGQARVAGQAARPARPVLDALRIPAGALSQAGRLHQSQQTRSRVRPARLAASAYLAPAATRRSVRLLSRAAKMCLRAPRPPNDLPAHAGVAPAAGCNPPDCSVLTVG